MPTIIVIAEGSCGIYYRFGKLSSTVSTPGINFKLPYSITETSFVRSQVDEILSVFLPIMFPMIKVFNQNGDVYQKIYILGENYLVIEQVKVKVVEMCTAYTAEELYTKEFSKLNNGIIFNYLKEMQELHQSNLTIAHVLKLLLPTDIIHKYEQVGSQKASLEAEIQAQLRQMKEQETISKLAKIIEAENEA